MLNRIRDLREDHDLTQADVAKFLCVSPKVYGRYERGEFPLPARFAILLALYYNVSIDYLVDLTDDPRPPHRKWTDEDLP